MSPIASTTTHSETAFTAAQVKGLDKDESSSYEHCREQKRLFQMRLMSLHFTCQRPAFSPILARAHGFLFSSLLFTCAANRHTVSSILARRAPLPPFSPLPLRAPPQSAPLAIQGSRKYVTYTTRRVPALASQIANHTTTQQLTQTRDHQHLAPRLLCIEFCGFH
jgi:hypothetical protein